MNTGCSTPPQLMASFSFSALLAGLALFISTIAATSSTSFPSLAFAYTQSIPRLWLASQHWLLFLLLNLVIGSLAVSSFFMQRQTQEREAIGNSLRWQKRPKRKTLYETLGNGLPEGETLYETLGNGLLEGEILYNVLSEGENLDETVGNGLLEGKTLGYGLPEGGILYNGLPEGQTADEDLYNGLFEEETLDNGPDLQIHEPVYKCSSAVTRGFINGNLPEEEEETLVNRPEEENIDEMEQEQYFDFEEETENREAEHNHSHRHSNEVWPASPPATARLRRSKSETTEVFVKRRRERKRERRIQLGKWKTFDARFGRGEKGDVAGDGEVDQKADAFIVRFHQQIKLQRLHSLIRNGLST